MKIRKIQQRSIYFETLDFDWMKVDKESEFYILENGHEIEGAMALKERNDINALIIILIEVNKKNIGKRIGTRLISYACNEAIKRKKDSVVLEAKTKLINYYKSIGAEIVYGKTMEFKEDNLKKLGGKYGN